MGLNKYLKISLLILANSISTTARSQIFGGYKVLDHLVSAVHPNGCDPDYVTGYPNDSIWVNFNNNDKMTGRFGSFWSNSPGYDLLLETGYHPDNYNVRLQLSDGNYSNTYRVYESDWCQLNILTWRALYTDCPHQSWDIGTTRYILPLDFEIHFGLNSTNTVVGIEITFLSTVGDPDLAGAYIISQIETINIGNDTMLSEGQSLILDATTSNATYLWQDNSINPTLTVTIPGTYWVKVKKSDCGGLGTINVLSDEDSISSCHLAIAGAFTPNSDGINDRIGVFVDCSLSEFSFSIFNRWGEKIYFSNTPSDSWDGKHKGALSPIGVYVYQIIYKANNDSDFKIKQGNITLIR